MKGWRNHYAFSSPCETDCEGNNSSITVTAPPVAFEINSATSGDGRFFRFLICDKYDVFKFAFVAKADNGIFSFSKKVISLIMAIVYYL
jgi:hypothetical protein